MASHKDMCNHTISAYCDEFRCKPDVVSVSPGRVNLIGEHVDHQGFSVLPAALNQTIEVSVGLGDGTFAIQIVHANKDNFPTRTYKTLSDIMITPDPVWTNYVIASILGIFEFIAFNGNIDEVGKNVGPAAARISAAKNILPPEGLRLLVDGRVPCAAGVSSSSALVVGVSIAVSHFLNVEMSREVLAMVCANSERHTGINGGGMDQAAICLCKKGAARLIHFGPLRTEAIELPRGGVLVVCNSGRQAPKAVSAASCYNKRVFELTLACVMVLKKQFPDEAIRKETLPGLTVKNVLETLKMSLADAYVYALNLSLLPIGRNHIEAILGTENLDYLLNSRGHAVWDRNVRFEPIQRLLHVLSEALRVDKFVNVCRDTSKSDEEKLKELGKLINASGDSLELLFDCGCPELSELTALARKSGAYGSRLTGAGWGGCTVSLVHEDNVTTFLKKRENRLVPINVPNDLSSVLFAVKPADGASVFTGSGDQIRWV